MALVAKNSVRGRYRERMPDASGDFARAGSVVAINKRELSSGEG